MVDQQGWSPTIVGGGGLSSDVSFAGLLRMRHAKAKVADLVLDLQNNPEPRRLQAALSQALGDPSLTLAFRASGSARGGSRCWIDAACWVDIDGRPTVPGRDERGELTAAHRMPIVRRDEIVAVLVCDPALATRRELLDAAVAAVGLAIDNTYLYASLQAQLVEVRAAKGKVAEAALDERRRIQRDLHDGAQQGLLTALTALDQARHALVSQQKVVATGNAAALLDFAHSQLDQAVSELRDLTHAIYPVMLVRHGLAAVVASITERAPLPVTWNVSHQRWEADVELVAYFVVCEGLANVYRHSQASSAHVTVRSDGWAGYVTVTDDGVGGAPTTAGGGLRTLHERVAALAGSLTVTSPPGGGTTLSVTLPLART